MFVFREAYYVEREKPPAPTRGDKEAEAKFKTWQVKLAACANKAEVIVAKARHGRVGYVDLHYSTETAKFSDIVRHEYPNLQPPERTWPYE
jgi:replicative DNA helicase